MSHLSLAYDVVQRLRGHWRRSLSEPLRGRSAILVLPRVLADDATARLPHHAPYALGPESFRRLLDHLTDHAQIVTLANARRLHRDPLPRIALTFDGGWRDTAEVALRQLERLALPASMFLTTGWVNRARGDWWNTLGDALWEGIQPARVRDCLGDAGLPLPPARPAHPGTAYSHALRAYLEGLAHHTDPLTLARLGDALGDELDIPPQTLDPFSIRRLESSGLVRFGASGVRGSEKADAREARSANSIVRGFSKKVTTINRVDRISDGPAHDPAQPRGDLEIAMQLRRSMSPVSPSSKVTVRGRFMQRLVAGTERRGLVALDMPLNMA